MNRLPVTLRFAAPPLRFQAHACVFARTFFAAAASLRFQSFTACALLVMLSAWCRSVAAAETVEDRERLEFFEKKIRPVFVEHCYRCHSGEAPELRGELRLDLKAGWQLGGESGQPAVMPGKPEESPLLRSVRHDADLSAMPPGQSKLPAAVIADLATWIKSGAIDPRSGELKRPNKAGEWEAEYQRRLSWWSLKPVIDNDAPRMVADAWSRSTVDRWILAKLRAASLNPVDEAGRRTLARRLSFTLTGLPPAVELVEEFAADASPDAFTRLVDQLLDSPRFGERWARHWMDVVHYADTHGYEWDVPAKNAWRYRDYLVRAFNSDVPYDRLVLEQIAGDLLDPRVDPATGVNESLIGPMMLRLGERRHGDNSAVEGVTQEAVANMIDTLGKAFLGTTLACAQCHDHKLDAVAQRDYYSLAGMLMSTRFSARPIDAVDPNLETLDKLRSLKLAMRTELGRLWLAATDPAGPDNLVAKLRAIPASKPPATAFPNSLADFWQRSLATPVTAEEFAKQREQRVALNGQRLMLIADFTREDGAPGWKWEGSGMRHGAVRHGELVVSDSGDMALQHLLPAGRFSHAFSQRLAGSLQSPQFDTAKAPTISVEMASGKFASLSFVIDRALNPERLRFPAVANPGWQTLTAGNFDSLEGTVDRAERRVYLELATKALNNYFPPRIGYGGVPESEVADARSWFGVVRVFQHAPGQPPQDELERFAPLFSDFASETDWARRLSRLVQAAAGRWVANQCSADDTRLLNEALQLKLLPHELTASVELARLVAEYREHERRLVPDRTVGSAADWNEGADARIGIRGSYTQFGPATPRGRVRLLDACGSGQPDSPSIDPASAADSTPPADASSGRLAWARQVVDPRNPLTARVYVNRVWHYLFGEGLVRTPDDFGHLGEPASHPELLDHLAARFMANGWSTKRLIRDLLDTSVWRQASVPRPEAMAVDPENRRWHHRPARRLEAEALRDAILAVSGRLDRRIGDAPIEPYRTAADSQKRLLPGPLDGLGRRSLYLEMTLMEPPRFLALFNQPLPKQTVGRRDVTNVPDQALALLNDPFVVDQAKYWSGRLLRDGESLTAARIERMVWEALGRPARPEEVALLVRLVERSAALRGQRGELLASPVVWQDAAHAVFNLKEFLYVP